MSTKKRKNHGNIKWYKVRNFREEQRKSKESPQTKIFGWNTRDFREKALSGEIDVELPLA